MTSSTERSFGTFVAGLAIREAHGGAAWLGRFGQQVVPVGGVWLVSR